MKPAREVRRHKSYGRIYSAACEYLFEEKYERLRKELIVETFIRRLRHM